MLNQKLYDYWLTRKEQETINETMAHHDLTSEQQTQAKILILKVARKGGRFYAYHTTHNICAKLGRK